jgi:hypothetical protein
MHKIRILDVKRGKYEGVSLKEKFTVISTVFNAQLSQYSQKLRKDVLYVI